MKLLTAGLVGAAVAALFSAAIGWSWSHWHWSLSSFFVGMFAGTVVVAPVTFFVTAAIFSPRW